MNFDKSELVEAGNVLSSQEKSVKENLKQRRKFC